MHRVLQALLPPPAGRNYNLRDRLHHRQLPGRMSHLTDCNVIVGMQLICDSYWLRCFVSSCSVQLRLDNCCIKETFDRFDLVWWLSWAGACAAAADSNWVEASSSKTWSLVVITPCTCHSSSLASLPAPAAQRSTEAFELMSTDIERSCAAAAVASFWHEVNPGLEKIMIFN